MKNKYSLKICRIIIQSGCGLLKKEQIYTQVTILKKLDILGISISSSLLNNMIHGKRASRQALIKTCTGIEKIIYSELGLTFNTTTESFDKTNTFNWEKRIIPIDLDKQERKSIQSFTFHPKGRLPLAQKIDFIKDTQHELIEFGVRLHDLSTYYTSRSDEEYKDHIMVLLKKGVHIKHYLINPISEEARIYFKDRTRANGSDSFSLNRIEETIVTYKKLMEEFKNEGFSEQFKVYIYNHIPYNYFLSVDGGLPYGKLLLSHYIYGIKRGKCPVMTLTNKADQKLYQLYWTSLQAYIKEAELLAPQTS